MSHQDAYVKEDRLNADCLNEAFLWLFKGIDWSAIQFRIDCGWMPATFAAMALLFAWSSEPTLIDRFRSSLKIIEFLFPEERRSKPKAKKGQSKKRKESKHKRPSVSYQAFVKMLRTWTATYVALFQAELRRRMPALFPDLLMICGFIVFGCDGSRVDLARTRSNEKAYAPSRKKNSGQTARTRRKAKKSARNRRRLLAKRKHSRKADVPQIWVTLMFHLGTRLPWDWRLGPSDSSERAHLLEMLLALPPLSLIAADAGFVGYEYLSAIHQSGRSLLIRVGSNVRLLKKLGYFKESGNTVYLWPDHAASKKLPPLVLRLVVAHNGKHPVYLVTNVLSQKRLTNAQVITIYSKRWGIEVHYRHFKQTFQKRKLRSHNSENARVELEWSLLALWIMLLYALVEVRKSGADPSKLSCAETWREIRNTMRDYRHPVESGERLRQRLKSAVTDDYIRKDKTSRNYPRKKQETPAGAPKIHLATKSQIKRAKELSMEQRSKGLRA